MILKKREALAKKLLNIAKELTTQHKKANVFGFSCGELIDRAVKEAKNILEFYLIKVEELAAKKNNPLGELFDSYRFVKMIDDINGELSNEAIRYIRANKETMQKSDLMNLYKVWRGVRQDDRDDYLHKLLDNKYKSFVELLEELNSVLKIRNSYVERVKIIHSKIYNVIKSNEMEKGPLNKLGTLTNSEKVGQYFKEKDIINKPGGRVTLETRSWTTKNDF